MGKLLIITVIFIVIMCVLLNFLIKTIFRLRDLIKYGEPPSTGMYYDAELGSINGEIDNRGKYICDCCEKRFKTQKELKVHLRKTKIEKLKNEIN